MKRKQGKTTPKAAPRSIQERWGAWFESKAPLFQFSLKFCGLLALFFGLSFAPLYQRLLKVCLTTNARVASAILDRLGEDTKVTEATTIWSGKYAITVLPSCSAFELLAFFCALVVAFPSRLSRKLYGILFGVLAILAVNQLRITSLFYVGAHFPTAFDTTHEYVWSMGLIVAEIVVCLIWIGWAQKSDEPEHHAVA
jgi:exosortase H (IPTLxxWG-CTERM-specific)